eukprot:7653467-Pyramimonas_sp.AAC.1
MAWHAMRTVEYIKLLQCMLLCDIALYSLAWCTMVLHSIVQHGAVALHFPWPVVWRQITGRPFDDSGGGGMRKRQEETDHDLIRHDHFVVSVRSALDQLEPKRARNARD